MLWREVFCPCQELNPGCPVITRCYNDKTIPVPGMTIPENIIYGENLVLSALYVDKIFFVNTIIKTNSYMK
jgi:hypothetical protein